MHKLDIKRSLYGNFEVWLLIISIIVSYGAVIYLNDLPSCNGWWNEKFVKAACIAIFFPSVILAALRVIKWPLFFLIISALIILVNIGEIYAHLAACKIITNAQRSPDA